MNPLAVLPFFSTLLGGYAALKLRHRLHAIMALAAGVVVATAVADLLPEAFQLAGEQHPLAVGIAAVIGFIGFSLVEAFLHQSSFEHAGSAGHAHDGLTDHADHDHDHAGHDHDHDRGPDPSARDHAVPNGFLAVLPPLSLIIHSTLDGLAIGLAFQAGGNVGFIVLAAVLAHDFADGMNVVTLVLDATRGRGLAVLMLVLDAIAPIAGAAIGSVITVDPAVLGVLLAGFGGVFIAIGAGHLLPEAQHRDPGRGPSLVLVAGLGAVVVLVVRALAPS